jgi:hypothetical protein
MQKQELRKNYIGILSERIDEQCTTEPRAKYPLLMKGFLRGLMASVFVRRGNPDSR